MSLNGNRVFKNALLFESAANIGSIFGFILLPEFSLSCLVDGPSQITPAGKSLMQWFGAVIVVATAPLLLSYPEAGQSASVVIARRRLTYQIMGAAEIALGLLAASQYVMGGSGLSDTTLLLGTGFMGAFIGMRAFFLYVKPQWMEAEDSSKKTQ